MNRILTIKEVNKEVSEMAKKHGVKMKRLQSEKTRKVRSAAMKAAWKKRKAAKASKGLKQFKVDLETKPTELKVGDTVTLAGIGDGAAKYNETDWDKQNDWRYIGETLDAARRLVPQESMMGERLHVAQRLFERFEQQISFEKRKES